MLLAISSADMFSTRISRPSSVRVRMWRFSCATSGTCGTLRSCSSSSNRPAAEADGRNSGMDSKFWLPQTGAFDFEDFEERGDLLRPPLPRPPRFFRVVELVDNAVASMSVFFTTHTH